MATVRSFECGGARPLEGKLKVRSNLKSSLGRLAFRPAEVLAI